MGSSIFCCSGCSAAEFRKVHSEHVGFVSSSWRLISSTAVFEGFQATGSVMLVYVITP